MGSLERTDTVPARGADMRTLAALLGLAAAVHGANIPAYYGAYTDGTFGNQVDDNSWGYDGMTGVTLPAAWGGTCDVTLTTTKQQSPIDIVTATAVAAPSGGRSTRPPDPPSWADLSLPRSTMYLTTLASTSALWTPRARSIVWTGPSTRWKCSFISTTLSSRTSRQPRVPPTLTRSRSFPFSSRSRPATIQT